MRQIKTFILRLYIDSEAPERLCGDVQVLPKLKTFPYKNKESLIVLLHRLASQEILMEQDPDKLDHLPTQEIQEKNHATRNDHNL